MRTTDFELSRERVRELYTCDYDAAKSLLEPFDFEAYVAAFRSGGPAPTRGENIVDATRRAADQGS